MSDVSRSTGRGAFQRFSHGLILSAIPALRLAPTQIGPQRRREALPLGLFAVGRRISPLV
ncbi:hypothetical protein MPC4_50188 [Methylocella tundrae]|uniref:Uncharacterized protein n=1 Tax=Methylocella tundrae TaxID=227605 RepID=A0A8B6MAY1_METTU|nr:hypothetical protein [Methylocella tundrae]VTZ22823.1 hypothetical protein MPC1_13070001 [Methylocella tundrae]VTZ51881.1 hypothetical protein MPC4_50188 [Methylocella tundrae]